MPELQRPARPGRRRRRQVRSAEEPAYIAGLGGAVALAGGQNVAVLSISAAASILGQYVSLNVAPGGIGEPGPLQYVLSTHTLEHLDMTSREHCLVEAITAEGDLGRKANRTSSDCRVASSRQG